MSTSTTERRVFPRRGIGRLARIYSALFRISILGQKFMQDVRDGNLDFTRRSRSGSYSRTS